MGTTRSAAEQGAARLRRPPQVTLGLDSDACVLYVNKDLAGKDFAALPDEPCVALHELVHPECGGDCHFQELFRKAWASLKSNRASVEWEVDDAVRGWHLRLNLSRPPTGNGVAVDRRRLLALLTITDITETRREYESVISSNEELQRRISELEKQHLAAGNELPANDEDARLAGNLGAKIIEAQEHERRRIAADLHDGVAQTLSVVKFGIESRLADLQRKVPDLDLDEFEHVLDRIREALDDLRRVSRNLSPAPLSDFGLCAAVNMLCDEFSSEIPDIQVDCTSCVDEYFLPDVVKISIYRVIQEALNNIGKHANAGTVDVSLTAGDHGMTLKVTDDGDGFDAEQAGRGMGLRSMRERVEVSGGDFGVRTSPQAGTEISATWTAAALELLGN